MRPYNYSGISMARKCEQLFKYVYVDQLKADTQPSGDMAFGTAMHTGVEAYLEGEDGVEVFKLFWDLKNNNRYGRYNHDSLREQGITLLERFKRLHLKRFKVYEMERKIEVDLTPTISMYGTPDFVGEFDNVPSLLDFKTSGTRYHKDRAAISEQLYLYAHLWHKNRDIKIQQIVYFVFVKGKDPSIQVLKTPYVETTCLEVVNDLISYCNGLQQVETEGYWRKNRSNCIMGDIKCDYFDKCHKGG